MYQCICANAVLIIFFVWKVTKRYGTMLNPMSFFGSYYFMATVVGPAVYLQTGLFVGISDHAVVECAVFSGVYFVVLGCCFLVPQSPFLHFFDFLFARLRPIELSRDTGALARVGLLGQFLACYILLMFLSKAGLMWITSTRDAYQYHREGVGVWWSLCQATLMLLFVCTLFRSRKTGIFTIMRVTVVFAVIALFLGSKASTLAYFVVALFFTHFCVHSLKTRTIWIAGMCVLTLALALQLYQGTAGGSVVNTLLYFDYFRNSASFLDRYQEFGFHYGELTFSQLWYFVPRAVYHAKPFAYGQMTINEFLFPGAAENSGYTAGFMQWSLGYGDFGVLGVVLSALITGFFAKGAYEFFLIRKDIQSFALLTQLGFIYYIEMFPNAPFLLFLVWLAGEIAFIRVLSSFGEWPVRLASLHPHIPRIRLLRLENPKL
jgi:hypothetical protein